MESAGATSKSITAEWLWLSSFSAGASGVDAIPVGSASTVTVIGGSAATSLSTPMSMSSPSSTKASTPVPQTPTPEEEEPGFGAVLAIAGLLAVAYLALRKRK